MVRPDLGAKVDANTCPYCGAPLLSRHARREHLTLKVCRGRICGDPVYPPGRQQAKRDRSEIAVPSDPPGPEKWAEEAPPRRRR